MNYDTIIPNSFDKNVEINKRAFDGLYNLWSRTVEWNQERTTYSIIWSVVGVFDSFESALAEKQILRKRG